MASNIRRFGLAFCILALVAFAAGCGVEQSPVAQEEAAVTQAEDGRMLLTFSPEAAQRAAKIVEEGRTVSQLFNAQSGNLVINDDDGLKVTLSVPQNALAADEQITMTAYGNTLSELVVAFEPGGLVFLIASQLEIRLDNELVDLPLDGLQAWHILDDGTVEPAGIVFVDEENSKTYITLDVPGFSRYSLGP